MAKPRQVHNFRGRQIWLKPQQEAASFLYQEGFESYGLGVSMLGVGDQQYTVRQQTAVASFDVVVGKYGELKDSGGTWAGITCNAANLASVDNYTLDFDVKAIPGGRWVCTFRHSATGGYYLQHIPGSELRLRRFNAWDPLSGLVTIQNWDASSPVSVSHVRVILSGTNIRVKIDGGFDETKSDPTHSAGTIGFVSFGAGGWHVDNITVI